MKTNASEPLMTCRKRRDDVKTGGQSLIREKLAGSVLTARAASGMEVRVSVVLALVRNVGTCGLDAKEDIQVADPQG
jgi:hypothetical protein